MTRPNTPNQVMVLLWASGRGSVPEWLSTEIDAALEGADVGGRSVWHLRRAVLSLAGGPGEQVPESTRTKLSGACTVSLSAEERGLADRIVAQARRAVGEILPARLAEVFETADRIAADEQRMTDAQGREADGDAVTLTLRLIPALAEQLWTTRTATFALNQFDRFEVVSPGVGILDPQWSSGSQMWCMAASDAVMLMAYEQACGFDAALLWDTAADAGYGRYVVLTTRPYA